ncbi:MAG TPA: CDP-glucose 4,6-dehydratase [Gammaproteobacteria bacterium]|nr:CDP-glucose 4,6-dehydratase [Gammaproteobacteria bacterium]
MTPEFWNGKKVLVTGHTGFKGSWLSLWLQHMGAEVSGYALPAPTRPSLFEKADVVQGMHSVEGNVCDLERLTAAVQECRPEIIIHMAAQALVRYSYDSPVETYATNVMGTVNLLEAARHTDSVRVVLNITSDKCYDNKEWLWPYRENEPMGGHDPYSSSKGCAELVTEAYRKSYFSNEDSSCAVASARAGNVIGGGDWASDRLIPDIVRAFAQSSTVIIRSPGAIRPWQHVLEPLNGYLTLVEHLWEEGQEYVGGWNFGPAEQGARPVQWIVERMIEAWGEGATYELDSRPQPHEANYLKLDSSKARALLGWAPKLDLARTLQWLTEWYRACEQGEDMRAYTLAQIGTYQQMESL